MPSVSAPLSWKCLRLLRERRSRTPGNARNRQPWRGIRTGATGRPIAGGRIARFRAFSPSIPSPQLASCLLYLGLPTMSTLRDTTGPMRPRARRRLAEAIAFGVLTACSTAPRDRSPSVRDTGVEDRLAREADRLRAVDRVMEGSDRSLRVAEGQLARGNPAAAVRILEDLVRESPESSSHDRALYRLASALIVTGNASGDYWPALAPLTRLLREHPNSPYVTEARALRVLIGAYVARTAERDRLLKQLKAEFDRSGDL
jgi:hypothetical protein